MPNNYCQTFKQKIEELKGKAQSLEGLLLEYRETGNEKIAQQLVEEIDKILQEIEEFKKEYEEKVKELLIEWYPKKENINEFLQNLKINEKGRVEIEKLDLSFCNLSGTFYLLSLFEKIKILNCSGNHLTSLPELPDGLKRLSCYNNKLTSLPELPAGLQWLNCFHNPLSRKTIKKIKSHPNYNIHTWLI